MRNRILTLAGLAALAATLLGTTAASAQSIIGDPGVYLSSTPTLTIAAPNKIASGKVAVLKTCRGNGDCSVLANDKTTETFDFVANTTKVYGTNTAPTGFRIVLHGTDWALTVRGSSVVFEPDHNYASQNFNGSTALNTTTTSGVLRNQKTGLNLTHTGLAAYQPVIVGGSQTHWGNSS